MLSENFSKTFLGLKGKKIFSLRFLSGPIFVKYLKLKNNLKTSLDKHSLSGTFISSTKTSKEKLMEFKEFKSWLSPYILAPKT